MTRAGTMLFGFSASQNEPNKLFYHIQPRGTQVFCYRNDKGAGCSSVSRGLRMHRALGLLSINKKKIDAFPVAGLHRRDVWTSP